MSLLLRMFRKFSRTIRPFSCAHPESQSIVRKILRQQAWVFSFAKRQKNSLTSLKQKWARKKQNALS